MRPLNFTNWLSGEPNNAGEDENCADLDVSQNHQWVDIQCGRSDRAKPICQITFVKSEHRPLI